MDDEDLILITGAGGFLGRAVASRLQQAGNRIVLLDRSGLANDNSAAFAQIGCDICDAEALRRVFDAHRITAIVHLAAILPTAAARNPPEATEVNVVGSFNLLEMARRFNVQRFVFGSSLSIYGTCAPDDVVGERHRAAPEDLYGAAKLYVEQLGKGYKDLDGIQFVSVRMGRVVGAGARSVTSAWRSEIFELLGKSRPVEIKIPYVGTERVLLVHVDDVARSLATLVQARRLANAVYNAPCESVVVRDLKEQVECLNPNVTVCLGTSPAMGNPRLVDWSRFQNEFGVEMLPIFERLTRSAGGYAR